MDPRRKRKIRAVVLLTVALLLVGALVYTSFSAATEAATPSQLVAAAEAGRSYKLTGKVVDGSVERRDDGVRFAVRDRTGQTAIPVDYAGVVPDPFREGREVIVEGRVRGGTLMADRDSLVTKCPSKFSEQKKGSGTS
ncbi:cytochrome c maturation protein CcmE [soil metagenome]